VPVFVCPRCAFRETSSDRRVRHQPRGCGRCGFGFAFEMLDDFYAGPRCALIVTDAERRVLVAGHGAFAATGYQDPELIGREVAEALGLEFVGEDPIAVSLEWGVRKLGVPCTFRSKGAAAPVAASCDVFPAYDEDGGLMLALTPA
jgi:PAS domain-containing protein